MGMQARLHGFSQMESLVVVVVIGTLAAVVVPNSMRAGDTARVTARAQ
jgi:prepilin-type N-terminal cleavage/methylation domain-containing protein